VRRDGREGEADVRGGRRERERERVREREREKEREREEGEGGYSEGRRDRMRERGRDQNFHHSFDVIIIIVVVVVIVLFVVFVIILSSSSLFMITLNIPFLLPGVPFVLRLHLCIEGRDEAVVAAADQNTGRPDVRLGEASLQILATHSEQVLYYLSPYL